MSAPHERLILPEETRRALWAQLVAGLERYAREVDEHRVAPRLDPRELRELLRPFDFTAPREPLAALDFALAGLSEHQVHTPHRRYFGLFNPAPTTMGIAADAVVAAFNPQLAAWSHSPLAAEIERHLIGAFGERLGYRASETEGTFASGGAEANHTALLCALTAAFPEHGAGGLRALSGDPVLYVSAEGHHSVLKAARLCGLGTAAVREIEVDEALRLRPAALAARIAEDRAAGRLPFLVVATAGTTSAGVLDPLPAIAEVAAREGLWLHVDAAWGGAAALVPELRPALAGIERADSITLDAHKWLSVPMAAGMLLLRRRGVLERAFRVANAYMPKEARELGVLDPYASSMQWSRRFIGLKLFLSLAVAGWDGYAAALRHQTAMGDLLRARLAATGWLVVNETPLPTVCFDDPASPGASCEAVARRVVESGKAWISATRVGRRLAVLRACVTNVRTGPEDVETLVQALGEAREAARAAGELS